MVGQSHHASQHTHPLLAFATGKGHIQHIILYDFVAVRKERRQREIDATPSHPAQMCSGRGSRSGIEVLDVCAATVRDCGPVPPWEGRAKRPHRKFPRSSTSRGALRPDRENVPVHT
jgi:hypothetical protein